ncbi:MAG: substrate binding domain-containing protein [Myxococcota bacterium]
MTDLMASLDEANQSAAGTHAELAGIIRISAAGVFAERRVAPVLAEFARQHPRICIEIDFNTRLIDLVEQGFDFAVRYGVLRGASVISRKLVGRTMVCAASPAYLAERGRPQKPEDLVAHDCLVTNSDNWIFRSSEPAKTVEIRVTGRWRANSGPALQSAAVAGLGVAYAPELNLQPALARGELVRVLEGFEDLGRSSWLVYPEKRYMPLRVRRAIEFLVDSFRGTEFPR